MDQINETLLEVCLDQKPVKDLLNEVVTRTGQDREVVKTRLSHLRGMGLIENAGRSWVYQTSQEGIRFLQFLQQS